jgi:hypothetical protein
MRGGDSDKCSKYLRDQISRNIAPPDASLQGIGQCHYRIEVSAGDRAEGEDDGGQNYARCYRIREKSDSNIAAAQPLSHDSGPNDRREKQRRPQRFGNQSS